MQRRKQKRHSAKTKMRAVQEYLAGKGSLQTISQKYDIATEPRRLPNWIKYGKIEEINQPEETLWIPLFPL